jgi:hypothetical protein
MLIQVNQLLCQSNKHFTKNNGCLLDVYFQIGDYFVRFVGSLHYLLMHFTSYGMQIATPIAQNCFDPMKIVFLAEICKRLNNAFQMYCYFKIFLSK